VDENERLGALYAVAQEMQEAAKNELHAIAEQRQAMVEAAEKVDKAVRTIKAASDDLARLPEAVGKQLSASADASIKSGLTSAMEDVAKTAKNKVATTASSFSVAISEACRRSENAVGDMERVVTRSNWLVYVLCFLAGVAVASTVFLFVPSIPEITVDTPALAANIQKLLSACRK
jgi:hypothetical protein